MAGKEEHVSRYVVLIGTVEQEDNQFVSFCPELGVASCGDTVEEALDNLGDALEVHLNALEEIGGIERVFRERNVEIRQDGLLDAKVSVSIPPDRTVRAYPRQITLAGVV